MQPQDDRLGAATDLVNALGGHFVPVPTIRRGRVVNIPRPDGTTTTQTAMVQIETPSGSPELVEIPISYGMNITVNEEWEVGKPSGRFVGNAGWTFVRRVDRLYGNVGDVPDTWIDVPFIPAAEKGGVLTFEAKNALTDPGGVPVAGAAIYPRTVILGSSLNAYDPTKGITGYAYQIRTIDASEWGDTVFVPLYPPAQITVRTAAPLAADGFTVLLTVVSPELDRMLEGQAAYWLIGDEVVNAWWSRSTSILHITDHVGPGLPERGLDFEDSILGRAQDSTTAKAWPTGTAVQLLSGQIPITDLQTDTEYQIHVAHVTSGNRQSEYSDILTFRTWEQELPPPAPGSLTVQHLQAVIEGRWTAIPQKNIASFRVYRYDPAFYGQPAPAATTGPTPPANATLVAELDGFFYPVPVTEGRGNYLGVQGVTNSGVAGDIRWNLDSTPPPHPNPAHWAIQATPGGLRITLLPAFYSAGSGADKGFAGIEVWRNTTASLAGTPVIATTAGKMNSFPLPDDASILNYYQMVAVDWAGNKSTLVADPAYWKRDDGLPNAPAGVTVEALQGEFRVQWTLPSNLELEKIKQWRVDRAASGPTGIESRYVDGRTNVFNWSSHDYTAGSIAGALFFRVIGIGMNGVEGTFGGVWAQDLTAPAPPAPSSQLIRSDLGGVYIQISPVEAPQFDKSWREYVVLQATDAAGSGSTAVHWFNGRQTKYEFQVWDSKFFQVVSGDWVGNYGLFVPGAWVQARSLYPVDPRYGMPANGDFQAIDPTNPLLPHYWSFDTFAHTGAGTLGAHRFSSFVYDSTGGFQGSAAVRGVLGPDILDVADKTHPTLRTSVRMYIQPGVNYDVSFWLKIPTAYAGGQNLAVYMSFIEYANPTTPTPTAEVTRVTTIPGPRSAGEWVSVGNNFGTTSAVYAEFSVWAVAGSGFVLTPGTNWIFDNVRIVSP